MKSKVQQARVLEVEPAALPGSHRLVLQCDTCVESRWASGCNTVHLQKLSRPTSSDDIEAESSRTFREASVDGETLQLSGLLRELWH